MEYLYYLKTEAKDPAVKGQEKAGNPWASNYLRILLFLFISLPSFSQAVPEIGITGGMTGYLGDLNPSKLYKNLSYGAGARFVYNLNPRMGFLADINYMNINPVGYLPHLAGGGSGTYGDTIGSAFSMVNYGIAYYLNFLEFDPNAHTNDLSPYIKFGVGMHNKFESKDSPAIDFTMGYGLKYRLNKITTLGLEYNFYRTMNDVFDDKRAINKGVSTNDFMGRFVNNDWYSYLSLVITFKFINFAGDCPAYY